jgi:hypothetical protein
VVNVPMGGLGLHEEKDAAKKNETAPHRTAASTFSAFGRLSQPLEAKKRDRILESLSLLCSTLLYSHHHHHPHQ